MLFEPKTPLLDLYAKEAINKKKTPQKHQNIYSSTFCDSEERETKYMPNNWRMTKQSVVHECNGRLLGCE